MTIDITSEKMPEELQTKLENLSPFARRYAEFRAKGLVQADAANKAGSEASNRASQGRVGYNTEQQDGVKEYILWLEHKRAKASVIDDLEIVTKLREVYEGAMMDGKYADANKAVEHLGNMIGSFAEKKTTSHKEQLKEKNKGTKNNTDAFKDEIQHDDEDIRVKRLHKMLEDVKG